MKRAIIILSLSVLAFGASIILAYILGIRSPFLIMIEGILIGILLPLALVQAARKLDTRLWLLLGILVLAALLMPTSTLTGYFSNLGARLPAGLVWPVFWLLFFLPSIALLSAALLLYSACAAIGDRQTAGTTGRPGESFSRERSGRTVIIVSLVLCAAILGKTLYNLYWLLAWDMTYDPLDFLWLVLPVYAALLSGFILLATLPGRAKLASLYTPIVLALLAITYIGARQIPFRERNQAAAERVTRALDSFYAREGRYPQRLQELVPRDVRFFPKPFIIYGQDWCYEGGGDFYRLGYVDRDHWSSPNFSAQLVSASEKTPTKLPPLCESEIAVLQRRFQAIYTQGSR